jgi:hypothetical protein
MNNLNNLIWIRVLSFFFFISMASFKISSAFTGDLVSIFIFILSALSALLVTRM